MQTKTVDPYDEWLGIPPKDQPPNHYRLLGLELFEVKQATLLLSELMQPVTEEVKERARQRLRGRKP
jgi:hypothetical protein